MWPLNRYAYIFLSAFMTLGLSLAANLFARVSALRVVYRMMAFFGGLSLELWLVHPRLIAATSQLEIYAGGTALYKLEAFTILMTVFIAVLLQFLCEQLTERFSRITIPER